MMKKIIICIFVILMFTGCKNEHNINKTEFLAASEKEITTADTQATAAVSEPTLLETAAETETSLQIEPSPPSEASRSGVIVDETKLKAEFAELLRERDDAEFTEFYYPNVKIDGFVLYRAVADEWSFMYYYAPSEKYSDDYVFEFNDGILLGYSQTHWIDTADPLGAEVRKYDKQNIEYIYENGLLYTEGNNQIEGVVHNTNFTLNVPDSLNEREKIFEIGKNIIECTEIISLVE